MLIRVFLAGMPAADVKRWKGLFKGLPAIVNSTSRHGDYWKSLRRTDVDIVLLPYQTLAQPVDDDVARIRHLPDHPELVVLSNEDDSEAQTHLLAAGCLAVLDEQLDDTVLRDALATLIERRREQNLNRLQTGREVRRSHLSDFVSASGAMQVFIDTVHRVVAVDTPLLLCGETGVGKERLASAIHAESSRAKGPLVVVNCGALPEGLVESELFGHEEGAFTGASRARRGQFELAHQGTIFLDEVGEMPLHLQVKLLRVLQEHTIQRVGGESVIHVDVRVIAATNRDLAAEMKENRFRQDLYYRLAVVMLTIPPLRDRKEDIPALAQSYLGIFRTRFGKQVRRIAPDALRAMTDYPWPGNVRELINIMERATLLSSGEEIALSDLPVSIEQNARSSTAALPPNGEFSTAVSDEWFHKPWKLARREALCALEKMYLEETLRATHGRIGETAARCGIDPRALYEKLRRHGLRKEDYRGN